MAKKVQKSNYAAVLRETKRYIAKGEKLVRDSAKSSSKAVKSMAASTQKSLGKLYKEAAALEARVFGSKTAKKKTRKKRSGRKPGNSF
jgi:hypothetical protein